MEHLESFIILTNIKGLLFCVKRGGIYIMSYPYTTDLFFGSEKSSCDGVAHLSFGKPVIVGDKIRFISDPYEVSNDYTYDYDNDAFTFNTTKNAYTVLEIDKSVYDNLTDKPEFYGLEFRIFPYPPYSLFEDSSLETPVEDYSSLVPNTTYYYDENEYNDNSSVEVKSFTYTDGAALPHVEIILLDGGMSSNSADFLIAPLSDKDMTGLTVNERTPASLVTVNSHAFSASSEDPMEIPRYTEICACVIKTYINNVENKDDSYIPICEKQFGHFRLDVSVQQEGYDDGLPSNNEEFQLAITEGKAFPIQIKEGDPKQGIYGRYWNGKVSIDDQDPIDIDHDNVVGFVTVTSGTSTFNSKVRPTPPYDESTNTWNFGMGIPLGIDYYVILKQPIA